MNGQGQGMTVEQVVGQITKLATMMNFEIDSLRAENASLKQTIAELQAEAKAPKAEE